MSINMNAKLKSSSSMSSEVDSNEKKRISLYASDEILLLLKQCASQMANIKTNNLRFFNELNHNLNNLIEVKVKDMPDSVQAMVKSSFDDRAGNKNNSNIQRRFIRIFTKMTFFCVTFLEFIRSVERIQLDFMDLTKKVEDKLFTLASSSTQNESKKLATLIVVL